ncbi:50S ribosomal protein L1 [Candidatus Uhrbacteria bacterium RIFCSPHIGHO2_01_FULL_63_20]|uniref:Large ribosomal subunit protein uL1 n=1 Tax=Candidatus Uhrbacteria bacterium RIFCSPHIGHO2_01_FULL_63_20 TaxID=1802385 RepID=A0A1F7TL63_9BACT|nr:MAG: 50S ribosomal protein L1 [Candidatus Uhrbacteria bacterium RIFCSPHIGHO2_01_FULL_63_20]
MAGKKTLEAKKMVDPKKTYTVDEAIALVKTLPKREFDESVELHVRLGIDPTKGDQQVRGTIAFPHGVGKSKRVAAFVEAAKEAEAKAAGADLVGGEELIAEIATKQVIDFDVAVATPAMMPKLAKLAKTLGPKGLMPNPKTDTVGPNVGKMVAEQKAGKQTFKNDSAGNVHQIFGRVSFDEAKLKENLTALIELIKKMKPASSKGIYVKSATVATTMGPAIHIQA